MTASSRLLKKAAFVLSTSGFPWQMKTDLTEEEKRARG
jgi:hypothetical protein